jgi:hypothetical protein
MMAYPHVFVSNAVNFSEYLRLSDLDKCKETQDISLFSLLLTQVLITNYTYDVYFCPKLTG